MRVVALTLALVALAGSAAAQPATGFAETDGAALYRAACQACHMADGKGAVGAAAYPALAGNQKLAAAAFPITWVVRGHKAMPAMGRFLNDAQVAAVVTYVRTGFGNSFTDAVRPEDVAALRPR
jgi:mono/diheme cytochrome c family protein